MRQSNNERTQEIISMEEYLERRQEKRRTEFMKEPQKEEQQNGALPWKLQHYSCRGLLILI